MIMRATSWPCFHFIRVVVALNINKAVSLIISGVVSMGIDIAVNFFELFL